MSTDTPSPDPKKKRERGPGRPKAAFTHDATIQLRLTRKQLTELEKQAQRTKMSRSAVIRAALDGVQVLQAAPNEELLKERRQEFFQLAKLATNLNQLVVLVRSAPVVALQTQATIDRVQQVLAEIQQTLPGT
jgi:multidrug efflux pump subunit AcrA (membrane-fusion protein)